MQEADLFSDQARSVCPVEGRPRASGLSAAIPRAEDAYAEHLRIEGKK
jgi:hypothetical protein